MASRESVTRYVRQLCPVCQGHGIVPRGFYDVPAGQTFTTTNAGPERCRQCKGGGVIRATEVVNNRGE